MAKQKVDFGTSIHDDVLAGLTSDSSRPLMVFVVGAGASKAISQNFPSGQQLAQQLYTESATYLAGVIDYVIAHAGSRHAIEESRFTLMGDTSIGIYQLILLHIQHYQPFESQDVVDFAAEMARTPSLLSKASIDAFLTSRTGADSQIGRLLIAFALLQSERSHIESLDSDPYSGERALAEGKDGSWDWLEVVAAHVIESLESGNGWRFAFTTFNYDRTIEYYLSHRLAGAKLGHRTAVGATRHLLREVPIVHVHGMIRHGFELGRSIGYGQPFTEAEDVQGNLAIIGEETPEFRRTSRIGELMSRADRVVFLGFGYDRQNLNRIRPDPFNPTQSLCGTTYRIQTTEERDRISRDVSDSFGHDPHLLPSDFDCLKLVRSEELWKPPPAHP